MMKALCLFFVEVVKMVITFPPDLEKKIIALAAQKKVDPASFVASLVAKELSDQNDLALANDVGHEDDDFDPEVLNRAVAAIANRTPEQIKAAQEMALREFQSERELPEGAKNVFDVIPVIRGNETDEQAVQ